LPNTNKKENTVQLDREEERFFLVFLLREVSFQTQNIFSVLFFQSSYVFLSYRNKTQWAPGVVRCFSLKKKKDYK